MPTGVYDRNRPPHIRECPVCHKRYRTRYVQPTTTCSMACSREYNRLNPRGRNKVGVKNVIDKHGYILIFDPTHPLARKNGYVAHHRRVWYDFHGKGFDSTRHIHHKNGDKQDNRISNLVAVSSSEHGKLHKGRRKPNPLLPCLFCNKKIHTLSGLCRKCYVKYWARAKKRGVQIWQYFEENGLFSTEKPKVLDKS